MRVLGLVLALGMATAAQAQLDALGTTSGAPNALTAPTLSPGELQLMKLEVEFAADVAKRGGVAFGEWFADDAVALSSGKRAVLGHAAIAGNAQWDPKVYHLAWTAEGARMGPSGDMGFTWGHYTGTSKDVHGQPVTDEGRYFTVWKKVGGAWKVALDGSSADVPGAGDCCALPKP